MARKSIPNYIFIPSSKQVIIPDPYKLSDILMITNVTRNTVIYNFGDPQRGGTVAYTNNTDATDLLPGTAGISGGQAIFTNLNNGYTTITLTFDTTGQTNTDQLMIYVESSELKVRPYDFGVDAVERMKVGTPQSLIDADFEYGMQPTKWVQYPTVNDMPTTLELPGTDLLPITYNYATFLVGTGVGNALTGTGATASNQFMTLNQTGIPTTLAATFAPISSGQYAMVIAQGQAGQPNASVGTTSITAQMPITPYYGGPTQRTFTVANTAGWSVGDIACVVEMPGEGLGLSTVSAVPGGAPLGNVWATISTTSYTLGQITALTAPTLTTATTGGTIANGTYYIRLQAVDPNGGSFSAAESTSITTTGSGTSTITVTFASLATGGSVAHFRIWFGTSTGVYNGFYAVPAAQAGTGTGTFIIRDIVGNSFISTGSFSSTNTTGSQNWLPGNLQLYINNASSITLANSIMLVETAQFGVWEAMAVTSQATAITSGPFPVIRNLWGTNPANAAILPGARIRSFGGNVTWGNANVETMRIDSIDSSTQFTVSRSWFNVNASPTFGANSIVFKVNHSANAAATGMGAGNIEIVRLNTGQGASFTLSTTTQGVVPTQLVSRGQFGTTPLDKAGPGSLFIPLTGVFWAGNASVPAVGMYIPSHGLGLYSNANVANAYISTIGISQAVTVSNIEGIFPNQINELNYIKYFPKTNLQQLPGAQLNLNDAQTIVRRGGLYSGANVVVANVTSNVGVPSLVTVTTMYPHGLLPGQAIQVQLQANAAVGAILEAGSGQFVIQSIPSPTQLQYVAKPNVVVVSAGVQNLTANITMFPTGLVKHRPIDGGNNIGTNTPAHGYEMTRQTKKAFRYQSGKGTMFTSGTQFCPTFSISNIVASGTTVGSSIYITTENEHGLQTGANISLFGVTTSGYNTFYRVATITNSNQLTVLATGSLGATVPSWNRSNLGNTDFAGQSYPRLTVLNWHGAKIRTGIFDDSNGVFYEYDGQTFWAVKRSSTNDLVGRVNLSVGSNQVTGDNTTRFLDQLMLGDQIVIKGMTHTVTQVVNQNLMYITPVYRGTVNAQDARITRVAEERTAQKAFNLDRLDGTGPSGYVMNLAKMQMVGIQYTWYGAGFVDYMMRAIDGKMVFAHRSKGNNINDEAYMRTGNLPARYQASNKGPRTWVSKNVTATATEIQLYNVSEFPTANATYPVTVQIDNELIRYTGVWAANGNITGLTRGVTSNQYILGSSRNLWAGSNAGQNWAGQGMPTNGPWSAQAFNPNGNNGQGVWVAISGFPLTTSSATAYSLDGVTWTAGGNLPSASSWIGLAYGRIGTTDYMVAVSNEATTGWGKAAFSTDNGTTWSNVSMGPQTNARYSSITFGYDGNQTPAKPVFVAVGGLGANISIASRLEVGNLVLNSTGFSAGSFYGNTAIGSTPLGAMTTSIAYGQVAVRSDQVGAGSSFAGVLGGAANINVPATSTLRGGGGVRDFWVAVGPKDATTAIANAVVSTDGGVTWANARLPGTNGPLYTSVTFVPQIGAWMAVGGGHNPADFQTGANAGVLTQTAAIVYGAPNTADTAWTTMAMPVPARWRSIASGTVYPGSPLGTVMAISDEPSITSGVGYTGSGNVAYIAPAVMNGLSSAAATVPTWNTAILGSQGSWTSIGYGGGQFNALNGNVALWSGANAYTNTVSVHAQMMNANIFLTTTLAAAGNITGIAYGAGNTVVVATNSQYANVSMNGGRGWANLALGTAGTTAGYLGASATWKSIAYAPLVGAQNQGRFLAIAGGNTNSQAVTWQDASNLFSAWTYSATALTVSQVWQSIAYVGQTGQGAFVAVGAASGGGAGTVSNYSANHGQTWTAVAMPSAVWQDVAGGPVTTIANINAVVAVSGGISTATQVAAWSNVVLGTSGNVVLGVWGQSTMPTSANWISVAYGNQKFVAIATGGTATAYSTNGGKDWTAGGALPGTNTAWQKVVYGTNGVWIAIGAGASLTRTTAAAYSVDDGVTWTAATMPSAQNWTNAVWASQHNQFIAVSGDNVNLSSNIAISSATGGLATTHTANTGARIVSVTASPDLNHWGSAVIMDGGFTVDRTYTFTYNVTNYASPGLPNATTTSGLPGAPNTVFMMRLAPSVSNSLTGELGGKELLNRAQVLLQSMNINVQASGSRFLVQGILNPTNIATAAWRPLNNNLNFFQPSFTQFVANNIGVYGAGAGVPNITYSTGNAATGGEQLFSIPVSQTNSGLLDLSSIKEITGMVLPGIGAYPNGPEVLAINIVPITTGAAGATASNLDVQITFIESQA